MCRNKVLFSQGGFFFPQLGKTQQRTGNKILCVFFFIPQNAIKAERLSVCILSERKKKGQNRFIWEEMCAFVILVS